MKFAAVVVLALLLIPTVAVAGPLQDGKAAYDRQDYQTAMKQLQPLADQGNDQAQKHLALMYDRGEGVKQNHEEAVKWQRKSFETLFSRIESSLDGVHKFSSDPVEVYQKRRVAISLYLARWSVDPPKLELDAIRQIYAEYERGLTPKQIADAKHFPPEWSWLPNEWDWFSPIKGHPAPVEATGKPETK